MEKLQLRNTINLVKLDLQNSVESVFGIKDNKLPLIAFTKSREFDYQSAFANKLFNSRKKDKEFTAKYKSVKDVSDVVKDHLLEQNKELIKDVQVTNNGFLIILLHNTYLQEEVNKLLKNGINVENNEEKQTIAVDFSSPNIAKEMHVGHLRSTIMGESICRIFEFQGHKVHRINHVGDWGTQFGMLIAHLEDKFPDYADSLPELKDLETFYKESKQRFDSDEEFKLKAQQYVVKLQSGDEKLLKGWKVLCDISRQFFNKVYEILDISVEEFGESFYNPKIPAMLKELEEKGLIKEDKGAKCIFVPKKKLPLMVVKSDGGFNYDTTDMAAANYRLNELKANRIVYLTDVGQKVHFDLIFEASKMAGWHNPPQTRMEHMGFGLICNETGGKMKTREGKTVKLMDLLEEAKKRAKDQLLERFNSEDDEDTFGKKTQLKEEEIDYHAEVLGIAAVKYFDMRQNRIQNYNFIYDDMLSQKGNTAIYLMYSYIRLCSILKKCGIEESELRKYDFEFTDENEASLARHIAKFPEIIEKVNTDLTLNTLCDYLYTLSVIIAECYRSYKINNNEHTKNRVQLILCAKMVMEKCFFLLNIKTVNRI